MYKLNLTNNQKQLAGGLLLFGTGFIVGAYIKHRELKRCINFFNKVVEIYSMYNEELVQFIETVNDDPDTAAERFNQNSDFIMMIVDEYL